MREMRKKLIDLLDEFPVQMEWHDNADLANYLLSNGIDIPVRCKDCQYHEPCKPYNKVWCQKMGRYMKPDGFCSEGKEKE